MCRNIKTLFNFEPPATEAEIRDASLQFVRKICGFTSPSKANELAFDRAVEEVTASARALIRSLVTTAEPRNREVESEKLRARSAVRFGPKLRSTGADSDVRADDADHWRQQTAAALVSGTASLLLLRFCIEKVVHHRDDDGHAIHQRDVCRVGQDGQSRC